MDQLGRRGAGRVVDELHVNDRSEWLQPFQTLDTLSTKLLISNSNGWYTLPLSSIYYHVAQCESKSFRLESESKEQILLAIGGTRRRSHCRLNGVLS